MVNLEDRRGYELNFTYQISVATTEQTMMRKEVNVFE